MIMLAVSQANANTIGVLGVALAFVVAGCGVWRYAVRRGRRIEKAAIEQAALKQLVDANLLVVVSGLTNTLASVQVEVRDVKQSVADLRKASKPNGKNTNEIGDQVALLRDDVAGIAGKLDSHLKQVDGG